MKRIVNELYHLNDFNLINKISKINSEKNVFKYDENFCFIIIPNDIINEIFQYIPFYKLIELKILSKEWKYRIEKILLNEFDKIYVECSEKQLKFFYFQGARHFHIYSPLSANIYLSKVKSLKGPFRINMETIQLYLNYNELEEFDFYDFSSKIDKFKNLKRIGIISQRNIEWNLFKNINQLFLRSCVLEKPNFSYFNNLNILKLCDIIFSGTIESIKTLKILKIDYCKGDIYLNDLDLDKLSYKSKNNNGDKFLMNKLNVKSILYEFIELPNEINFEKTKIIKLNYISDNYILPLNIKKLKCTESIFLKNFIERNLHLEELILSSLCFREPLKLNIKKLTIDFTTSYHQCKIFVAPNLFKLKIRKSSSIFQVKQFIMPLFKTCPNLNEVYYNEINSVPHNYKWNFENQCFFPIFLNSFSELNPNSINNLHCLKRKYL
jgi:hypothetical protein